MNQPTNIAETLDRVLYGLKPNSMANLFDALGNDLMSETGLSERTVRAMNKRMQTKSLCCMGDGVAIPNVKVRSLRNPVALLCVTDRAVACDTPDGKPIDIVCMVVSPSDDGPLHLQRLSRFSRLLKDVDLCNKIRDAKDADVIRALLNSPDGLLIAA